MTAMTPTQFRVSAGLVALLFFAPESSRAQDLLRQSIEEADRKSKGCVSCHGGIEPMHSNPAVKLGCTDCHLGDAGAMTKEGAHVRPRYPDQWRTSANPERSYTLLNEEDPRFIQFANPGDLRVADRACGSCHNLPQDPIVTNVKKSMMTTSTLLWGGAAYNNGIVSSKNYFFGESYSRDGAPQRINTVALPMKKIEP